MEAEAARYVGAGLACFGMGMTGFAVTEALGIFSLLIALLLLFV